MELTTTSIDRLRSMQSRTISTGEFNFDQLTAPPLMSIFDINDITRLENICTSIRYAGQPKKKKKAIQEIMQLRGFDRKYLSGTNRLAFRFPDDPRIIAKVAFDDKGRSDNPREFFNQHLIKPFVTKIFEVAGDGTVALVERVKPVKTREEFLSIADDVFSILWLLTKKYVIPDTGSRFFMNWGIREGFAPVLLDYPYMYEPTNIDQLTCHAKDIYGNMCGGFIDLDEGFNELVCTKCGVRYNASEIAKILKDEEIITRERGNVKMKVAIVRGSQKITTLNTVPEKVEGIKEEVKNIQPTNTNNNKEVTGRKITVNVSQAVREGREKKDAEARGNGKVTVKRGPREEFKPGKKSRFNPNSINRGEKYKVKVDRGSFNKSKDQNNKFSKKNTAPVQITAVSLEDLKETKFTMSTLDNENGLVFVKGKTPKGTDVSIAVDTKNIPWDEFDVKKESTEDYPDLTNELEVAKTDILKLEEKKFNIEAKNAELDRRVAILEEELKLNQEINNDDAESNTIVIENLKKVVEEKSQTIEFLERELDELKQTNMYLNESHKAIEGELKAINATKTVPYEEFTALESDYQNIKTKYDYISGADEAKTKQIEELADRVTLLQEELEKTKLEAKDLAEAKEITPRETVDLTKYEGILGISLLSTELRYTQDLADMTKVEDPNEVPQQVLVFPMSYEDEESGKIVNDYLRDQDNNILTVATINDVMIDKIKFEEA